MKKPTGYVIYQGPSLLDGAPIVCIATVKSRNAKTGRMVQTWILRADVAPMAANRTGADASICGTCPHRGTPTDKAAGQAAGRSCYVQLGQAPTVIFKTFLRGGYPVAAGHAAIAAIGRGRMVRLGAYGDQAAVPGYVAESLVSEASGHTAYSHQSGRAGASFNPKIFMVSADSERAAVEAWTRGERTFRVLRKGESPVAGKEITCPSLRGIHCVDCGLCGGAAVRAKSIAIPAHGAGAGHLG